jgi:hypothetical protein
MFVACCGNQKQNAMVAKRNKKLPNAQIQGYFPVWQVTECSREYNKPCNNTRSFIALVQV